SLSYSKIVQGERRKKTKRQFCFFSSEPQPVLFKDSARREKKKNKTPVLFFLFRAAACLIQKYKQHSLILTRTLFFSKKTNILH
ncbi:MAG: hypothetical protein SPE09_02315, partial [Alloprevotella sp.]|nr:hypothetical protein [Alloprevotella sp.]